MKVFENHFEGKTTILIDDRIINGCLSFTIEEASKVFEKYNVPKKYRKDILDNYTGKSTEGEVLKFVNHPDHRVRASLANRGYGLDTLINDLEPIVRLAVVEQGYGLDTLVNDSNPYIRVSASDKKKELSNK